MVAWNSYVYLLMLEFLCVDLHNQCDNVINQCYFIFCIVVYNGAEYILVLDFLWTHPNSLDWPIESSGPNNEWYISAKTLFLASSWLKRARTLKSTHLDWILGRKWNSSLNPDFHTIIGLSFFLNTNGEWNGFPWH